MWLYLLVAGGITFSAAAQVLLKVSSMLDSRGYSWFALIVASVILYGFSFVLYTLILKHFPLSVISPVMTIGTVALVVTCGVIMGESLSFGKVSGIVLGLLSIVLILQ